MVLLTGIPVGTIPIPDNFPSSANAAATCAATFALFLISALSVNLNLLTNSKSLK